MPNSTGKNVAHGVVFDTLIGYRALCHYAGGDTWINAPLVSGDVMSGMVSISITSSNVYARTWADRSMFTAKVIMEYTK